MKIYTKTGDEGMTSLVGGTRISKADVRLEAYGTVDELNSHIGLLLSFMRDEGLDAKAGDDARILDLVQMKLFNAGSILATDEEHAHMAEKMALTDEDISVLEKGIDDILASLPVVHSFLLPAGCKSASQAHVCRTVCRRTERCILRLHELHPQSAGVRMYVNRLSDYLFVLARKLNNLAGYEEKKWIPVHK